MSKKMIKKRASKPRQGLAKRQSVSPILPLDDDEVTPTPTPAVPPSNTSGSLTPTPSDSSSESQSSATSTSTSTSSTASSTSTSQSETETDEPDTTTEEPETESSSSTTRAITRTSITFETAGPSETVDKSKDPDASFLPMPVLIGLGVAAASCVCAAALWTIIRKWKFGASRKFEERLEPVNWEPSTKAAAMEHDPSAIQLHRGNSMSSHGHGSQEGQGSRNMASVNNYPVSSAPDFPPAHDFTAGTYGNGLAPGNNYADIHRGPSPAPSTNYGPSRQDYEVPNPYEAYGYNSGYNNNNNNYPQQSDIPGAPRHQF